MEFTKDGSTWETMTTNVPGSLNHKRYPIKSLIKLILSQDIMQGACQVALDGGNVIIAGGRQFIDPNWVDYKTGIVVSIIFIEN